LRELKPSNPFALARVLALLALFESAWLAYPSLRGYVLALEETPAQRGQQLAGHLGCFGCHGPGGHGGTPNPGSEEGTVPEFTGGAQMKYARSEEDIREYILDGAPRHKRQDPGYRTRMDGTVLHMPAYGKFLTESQLEDLIAFLRAASGQILPDQALAARGAEVAGQVGCFGCHGPLLAGGVENPGSFKGYIPALWGHDFDELVRSDAELHGWIRDGEVPRISEHSIGRHWFSRQVIKMPAYGLFLPATDIDALAAYVRWVRAGRLPARESE
jgi:mono/diheme cytochrome c family protein